jgi:2'-5' RNA ligase
MPLHGVAVTIPEPWGRALQEARESFGDPMASAIPPHVTLLPPTAIGEEAMDPFLEHLRTVSASVDPFRMVLSGTGTFRPVSPVVFVQVAGGLAECEQLEGAIRGGPLHRDLAFNYHPHVTVAHHVDEASMDRAFEDLAGYTCTFEVAEFHLYEHGTDRVWRAVHAFAFEAGPDHEDTLRR